MADRRSYLIACVYYGCDGSIPIDMPDAVEPGYQAACVKCGRRISSDGIHSMDDAPGSAHPTDGSAWRELSPERRQKVLALLSMVFHQVSNDKSGSAATRAEMQAMADGLAAACAALANPEPLTRAKGGGDG